MNIDNLPGQILNEGSLLVQTAFFNRFKKCKAVVCGNYLYFASKGNFTQKKAIDLTNCYVSFSD